MVDTPDANLALGLKRFNSAHARRIIRLTKEGKVMLSGFRVGQEVCIKRDYEEYGTIVGFKDGGIKVDIFDSNTGVIEQALVTPRDVTVI